MNSILSAARPPAVSRVTAGRLISGGASWHPCGILYDEDFNVILTDKGY